MRQKTVTGELRELALEIAAETSDADLELVLTQARAHLISLISEGWFDPSARHLLGLMLPHPVTNGESAAAL